MSDGSLSIDPGAAVTGPAAAAEEPASTAAAGGGTATLKLNPPEPVSAVAPAQAESAVTLDAAETAQLDAKVASYVDAVTNLDVHDAAFAGKVRDIQNLGIEDIKASADVSNRLLSKPLAAATRSGVAEGSDVSRSLLQLRKTIEDLDPQRQGDLLSPR